MGSSGHPQPPKPLAQTSLPASPTRPGLSSPRAHFVGLAPLPHPGCVGGTDGEAVSRVRLQLHQLDGGAQDLVEDPRAILCLGWLIVMCPGHLLQQDLVETDLLLAQGIGPGNLEEESPPRLVIRPTPGCPPLPPTPSAMGLSAPLPSPAPPRADAGPMEGVRDSTALQRR